MFHYGITHISLSIDSKCVVNEVKFLILLIRKSRTIGLENFTTKIEYQINTFLEFQGNQHIYYLKVSKINAFFHVQEIFAF